MIKPLPMLAIAMSALLSLVQGVAAQDATSDWRKELGTMRIGMIQTHLTDPSPASRAKIESDFTNIMEMPVEVVFTRDFPTLIEGQISGRVDYAIYSASAYATAHLLCKCIIPLVAPVAENGAAGLMAFLMVSEASNLNLNDVSTARIGWARGNTFASALLPIAGLTMSGQPLTGNEDFLKPIENEAQGVAMMNEGELDGIFVWGHGNLEDSTAETNAQDRLKELGLNDANLTTLWKSEFLRFGPHVVLKKIPLEARSDLINALLEMRDKNPVLHELLDETLGGGFEAVREQDYAPVISLVSTLSKREN